MSTSGTMSPSLDFQFQALRTEISFEANLIVQRTSWFVAAQAFFFASLAIDPKVPAAAVGATKILYFPHPMIPFLALIISVLTAISVHAAVSAARIYRERLNKFVETHKEYESLWKKPPRMLQKLAMPSVLSLPYVFLIAWAYLLFCPGTIAAV